MEDFATRVQRLRASLKDARGHWRGVSQAEFAARFGLSVGAVRDAEQGRVLPSRALRVLLTVFELDPQLAEKAALLTNDRMQR
jgi:putative transcriptional regulator